MEYQKKRKNEHGGSEGKTKKARVSCCFTLLCSNQNNLIIYLFVPVCSSWIKQWKVPKKSQPHVNSAVTSIEPGDAGIWVTCELHKEGKCTGEVRDLFNEVQHPSQLISSS